MGILSETRHTSANPIDLPVDHALKRHLRITKQPHGEVSIDQPPVLGLGPGYNRNLSKSSHRKRSRANAH